MRKHSPLDFHAGMKPIYKRTCCICGKSDGLIRWHKYPGTGIAIMGHTECWQKAKQEQMGTENGIDCKG